MRIMLKLFRNFRIKKKWNDFDDEKEKSAKSKAERRRVFCEKEKREWASKMII